MTEDYLKKARRIADDYQKNANDEVLEILLFPDPEEKEIRLVEIVPNAYPSTEGLSPWHFSPTAPDNAPYGLAVAIIRPDEKLRLELPRKWGSWSSAETLYPSKPKRVRR